MFVFLLIIDPHLVDDFIRRTVFGRCSQRLRRLLLALRVPSIMYVSRRNKCLPLTFLYENSNRQPCAMYSITLLLRPSRPVQKRFRYVTIAWIFLYDYRFHFAENTSAYERIRTLFTNYINFELYFVCVQCETYDTSRENSRIVRPVQQ